MFQLSHVMSSVEKVFDRFKISVDVKYSQILRRLSHNYKPVILTPLSYGHPLVVACQQTLCKTLNSPRPPAHTCRTTPEKSPTRCYACQAHQPLFRSSPQCAQLHSLQRADHHLGQRVLGRARLPQRHHRGLPPGLRALHTCRG